MGDTLHFLLVCAIQQYPLFLKVSVTDYLKNQLKSRFGFIRM